MLTDELDDVVGPTKDKDEVSTFRHKETNFDIDSVEDFVTPRTPDKIMTRQDTTDDIKTPESLRQLNQLTSSEDNRFDLLDSTFVSKLKGTLTKFSNSQIETITRIEKKIKESEKRGPIPTPLTNAQSFRIELKGPTFKQAQRRYKKDQHAHVNKILAELLDANIVALIDPEKAECISNATCVTKADGSLRFAFDARELNKITKDMPSVVPSIEHILYSMDKEANLYAVFDVKSAFWHFRIHEDDIKKTAFWGPDGKCYVWLVMAFGFKNAPTFFCAQLKNLLNLDNWAFSYFDDISVEARDWDSLLGRFEKVLKFCNYQPVT